MRKENEGFEVECACEGEVNDVELLNIIGQIHPIAFPRKASLLSFGRSIIELSKIIKKGNYDCVQSHNRNASIVARIAAWICKVPINLYTAHGMYYHDDQNTFKKNITAFTALKNTIVTR